MIYETTTGVQKLCHEMNYPVPGPYTRSCAIKPTSSAKKLKNRLSAHMWLNDEKIIVLVEHQKVLGWSLFFVCESMIPLPSLATTTRTAALFIGCRDVLKLVNSGKSAERDDFAPCMSPIKNDASDWMMRFKASLEWYLSTGICLSRFWKSIEDLEQSECHHRPLLKTGYVYSAQNVVVGELL